MSDPAHGNPSASYCTFHRVPPSSLLLDESSKALCGQKQVVNNPGLLS